MNLEEDYLEENFHLDEDTGEWMSNQLDKADVIDFITANNKEYFHLIKEKLTSGNTYLKCGIHKMKLPYYELNDPFTGKSITLFLNKEIISYILSYLQKGVLSDITPDVMKVDKNVTEDYILNMLKRDRINKATRYNVNEGYKAVYPHGTVSYGTLPYTVQELIVKLDSMV